MTKRRGHRSKTSAENPTAAAENPSVPAEGATVSPEDAMASAENPTVEAENPSVSAEGAMTSPERPVASAESPSESAEGATASPEGPVASAESPVAESESPSAAAERPSASVERSEASVEGPFAALAGSHGTVFEAMTRGVEACTKAGLLYQDALLRFAASRLEGDSKTWRALLTCKNWAEAAEIQRGWASSTAQDYVQEVGLLVQLTSRITAPWMASRRADASPAKGSGESHA